MQLCCLPNLSLMGDVGQKSAMHLYPLSQIPPPIEQNPQTHMFPTAPVVYPWVHEGGSVGNPQRSPRYSEIKCGGVVFAKCAQSQRPLMSMERANQHRTASPWIVGGPQGVHTWQNTPLHRAPQRIWGSFLCPCGRGWGDTIVHSWILEERGGGREISHNF